MAAKRNEGVNISKAPAGSRRPAKPPPAPPPAPSVTRNAKKPKVKTGAKRQQDLRERRKKEGKKTVSAVLDPAVFAEFENSRAVRGGIDGPYDADAYIVAWCVKTRPG